MTDAIQGPLVMPRIGLGNNSSMPSIGIDSSVGAKISDLKFSVLRAIELGYRHFHISQSESSEEPVGEAIVEALQRGLVKSRDELFVTSKLHFDDADEQIVISSLQKSLKKLQLEYVDLYLAQGSEKAKPGDKDQNQTIWHIPSAKDFHSVWKAMEECQRLGVTKSIRTCNITPETLKSLFKSAETPPSIIQLGVDQVWYERELREFCLANGIPIIARVSDWGNESFYISSQILELEVLKQIARDRQKTVAQVVIRWVFEQGIALSFKSSNKKNMKEILTILDWELSADDLQKISQIQKPQQN